MRPRDTDLIALIERELQSFKSRRPPFVDWLKLQKYFRKLRNAYRDLPSLRRRRIKQEARLDELRRAMQQVELFASGGDSLPVWLRSGGVVSEKFYARFFAHLGRLTANKRARLLGLLSQSSLQSYRQTYIDWQTLKKQEAHYSQANSATMQELRRLRRMLAM